MVISVALAGVFGPTLSGLDRAFAERQPGLLELLFDRQKRENRRQRLEQGAPAQRAAPNRSRVQQAPRARSGSSRNAGATVSVTETAETVQKAETARTVLVVGDFIAGGMAGGLVEAYAGSANVVVDSRISGSSGFVRDDHYDWPEQIGPILEEIEPDIVVMLIGSNDRQALRVNGSSADPLSDPWRAEYQRRVDAFLAKTSAAGVPVVWVGSPPFRFQSMSADMLAINDIFRTAVEAANGQFVDVWDGFVDAEGSFIEIGEDIKGQTVRLRNSDGINFTKAGRRKLAFYVERALMPMLGGDALPQITGLGPQNIPILKLPPLQTEADLDRINPIALTDPDLDGGSALLGDVGEPEPTANLLQGRSVRQMLVEDGLPPPSRPGRAGNFVTPPTGAAQAPVSAANPPG